MKLLKGKIVADKIILDLKNKIAKQKKKPGLAVILVGNNKASQIYVALKEKAANGVGINFHLIQFNQHETEKTILKEIKELNADQLTHGIIVQLPLPKKFNTQKIINAIDPKKDADGFSAQGGSASGGHSNKKNGLNIQPVFPQAIWKLLESSHTRLAGKNGVVIANSKIFGETMVKILKNKKIKAEYILSSRIKNQESRIKQADIVITAVGKVNFIKGEMLKKGAIVIDGGIVKKGQKVVGDAEFESVSQVAGYLSPVPGGVGPVTIACLLQNTRFLSAKGE